MNSTRTAGYEISFTCQPCSKEWHTSTNETEQRTVIAFTLRAAKCRSCGRSAQLKKMEPRK